MILTLEEALGRMTYAQRESGAADVVAQCVQLGLPLADAIPIVRNVRRMLGLPTRPADVWAAFDRAMPDFAGELVRQG